MNRENSQNGEQIFKGIYKRAFASGADLARTLDIHDMERHPPPRTTKMGNRSHAGAEDPYRWLIVDKTYPEQMAERLRLLQERGNWLIDRNQTPGIPAAEIELRNTVVDYLLQNYPTYFQREGDFILSPLADLVVDVGPQGADPLYAAALLASEDLVLMLPTRSPPEEVYTLESGALLFPNGWSLRSQFNPAAYPGAEPEKLEEHRLESLESAHLGDPMLKIHANVPQYQKHHRGGDVFLQTIEPGTVTWRRNWSPSLSKPEFCRHADRIIEEDVIEKTDENWQKLGRLRSEHQTLSKLPQSGAIVFSIKNYIWKLSEMVRDPVLLAALDAASKGLTPEMRQYREENLPSFNHWLAQQKPAPG